MTIIYAILIFCVLIFVHELGHFLTAKACGIKVNEFALGMGPAFFQKAKGETTYSLRILPIGGFCAMEGEDEESEDERAFHNKPAWQRAIVLGAGSLMNLITCIVLMIVVCLVMGTATTTIGSLTEGYPAEEAGIQVDDRLISINDNEIKEWNDVTAYLIQEDGATNSVVVERDGSELTFDVKSQYSEESQRYIMGVMTKAEHAPGMAVVNGVKSTGLLGKTMYASLKQLLTGQISTKELSGPVGIVYIVNKSAAQGLINLLYLTALLSLNLAIINMLPFPALDGGRLIFLIIRKIPGRAVTDKMEAYVHFAGIICLMLLMLYVTFNDVIKYVIPIFS